jgi:PhnB protein
VSQANEVSRRHFGRFALSAGVLAALSDCTAADDEPAEMEGDDMLTFTPYLLFDGTCHRAMEFYRSCFGGELTAIKVRDSPAKDYLPDVHHEKIVNARLRSGNVDISASDWLRPDRKLIPGNTVCLYLSGGTFEQIESLFEKLSEGAQVTDPLKEEFFGMYGALTDKFSVRWMFQLSKNAWRQVEEPNK